MKKREFLKICGTLASTAIVLPVVSCGNPTKNDSEDPKIETVPVNGSTFELPALPYSTDALAPNIDPMTMQIHHGKHHAGYVRKLNNALKESTVKGDSLSKILHNVTSDDTAVRNNGGGHYNHSLFWKIMSPNGGGKPSGDILSAINGSFGSFENFKEQFYNAAKGVFGSGWAWLCVDNNKKLFITSTPNQDNPLMTKIVEKTGNPIMGIDVWEHAYYLNYQNERGKYINNFFNVLNWKQIESNLKDIG